MIHSSLILEIRKDGETAEGSKEDLRVILCVSVDVYARLASAHFDMI